MLTNRRSETWEVRSSFRPRAKNGAGRQRGIGKLSGQLIQQRARTVVEKGGQAPLFSFLEGRKRSLREEVESKGQ